MSVVFIDIHYLQSYRQLKFPDTTITIAKIITIIIKKWLVGYSETFCRTKEGATFGPCWLEKRGGGKSERWSGRVEE